MNIDHLAHTQAEIKLNHMLMIIQAFLWINQPTKFYAQVLR